MLPKEIANLTLFHVGKIFLLPFGFFVINLFDKKKDFYLEST